MKYSIILGEMRDTFCILHVRDHSHFALLCGMCQSKDREEGKNSSCGSSSCYLALSSANQLVSIAYATPPYKERGNGSTSVVLEEALYLKDTHCHMLLLPRRNWALLRRNDLANAPTASARNVNSGNLGWATTHFQMTIYSPFFLWSFESDLAAEFREKGKVKSKLSSVLQIIPFSSEEKKTTVISLINSSIIAQQVQKE